MLSALSDWVLRFIFWIVSGLLGGVGALLPAAVKEHFFSSRERILSFIFLILIVNGAVKLILSALSSVLDLFGLNLAGKIKDRLLSLTNPRDRGYKEGYEDGRNYHSSRLEEIKGKNNITGKLWKVLKYFVVFVLLYSVVMTSDW